MSKIIYISPDGVKTPDLFGTFKEMFNANELVETSDFNEADICFVDLYSHVVPFDGIIQDIVKSKNIPLVYFEESDFGGMSREVFSEENYNWHNGKRIAFVRKMSKGIKYPEWVFPYEKTIQNSFPITTKEELCSRPYEIFFYGNTSPQRESVCNELSKHFKCDFRLGQEKIPHEQWLNRARQSKLFLTTDGGGFSCERPYQLYSISPMLRQKNNHLQAHPFSDCINCLEVSENPTMEEIDGIKTVLDDPDYLFEIYEEGVNHMNEYYSQEARANYIISILNNEGIL